MEKIDDVTPAQAWPPTYDLSKRLLTITENYGEDSEDNEKLRTAFIWDVTRHPELDVGPTNDHSVISGKTVMHFSYTFQATDEIKDLTKRTIDLLFEKYSGQMNMAMEEHLKDRFVTKPLHYSKLPRSTLEFDLKYTGATWGPILFGNTNKGM